jgi:hypothetical protein
LSSTEHAPPDWFYEGEFYRLRREAIVMLLAGEWPSDAEHRRAAAEALGAALLSGDPDSGDIYEAGEFVHDVAACANDPDAGAYPKMVDDDLAWPLERLEQWKDLTPSLARLRTLFSPWVVDQFEQWLKPITVAAGGSD